MQWHRATFVPGYSGGPAPEWRQALHRVPFHRIGTNYSGAAGVPGFTSSGAMIAGFAPLFDQGRVPFDTKLTKLDPLDNGKQRPGSPGNILLSGQRGEQLTMLAYRLQPDCRN